MCRVTGYIYSVYTVGLVSLSPPHHWHGYCLPGAGISFTKTTPWIHIFISILHFSTHRLSHFNLQILPPWITSSPLISISISISIFGSKILTQPFKPMIWSDMPINHPRHGNWLIGPVGNVGNVGSVGKEGGWALRTSYQSAQGLGMRLVYRYST